MPGEGGIGRGGAPMGPFLGLRPLCAGPSLCGEQSFGTGGPSALVAGAHGSLGCSDPDLRLFVRGHGCQFTMRVLLVSSCQSPVCGHGRAVDYVVPFFFILEGEDAPVRPDPKTDAELGLVIRGDDVLLSWSLGLLGELNDILGEGLLPLQRLLEIRGTYVPLVEPLHERDAPNSRHLVTQLHRGWFQNDGQGDSISREQPLGQRRPPMQEGGQR